MIFWFCALLNFYQLLQTKGVTIGDCKKMVEKFALQACKIC